jgi:hypothetical protein
MADLRDLERQLAEAAEACSTAWSKYERAKDPGEKNRWQQEAKRQRNRMVDLARKIEEERKRRKREEDGKDGGGGWSW